MAYSQSWLEDPSAIRGVLIEVTVYDITEVQSTTLYLSNMGYLTANGQTSYLPIVIGTPNITESMSLDDSISMSIGDVQLDNTNGVYDDWLDSSKFVWVNKPIQIYLGDPSWICTDVVQVHTDFLKVFDGVVLDIDSSDRDVLNIKLADKLQRLNVPITETTLGAYGTWATEQQAQSVQDTVMPLVFGEVFNISPILIDPSQLEYSFGTGQSERLIELRDNGVPVYKVKENIITYSEQFSQGSWSHDSTTTVTDNAILAPDGNTTADRLVETTTTAEHYRYKTFSQVSGTYTVSCYFKAAERNWAYVQIGTDTQTKRFTVIVDITNGTLVQTASTGSPVGTTYTIVPVGNEWFRVSATATHTSGNLMIVVGPCNSATPSIPSYALPQYTGDVTKGIYVWGAQVNSGAFALPYSITAAATVPYSATGAQVNLSNSTFKLDKPLVGTLTASVQGTISSVSIPNGTAAFLTSQYTNGLVNTIATIVTQYGINKLDLADLDTTNLYSVATVANPPIGIYMQDRGNILQICQSLLSSIGAQMYVNRLGKLQVLRVGVPTADPLVYITESDTILGSLHISNKAPVLASVKLGYCKNWTKQPALITNIPTEHKDMMAEEWYSSTVTSPTTATTYGISLVPVQKDTLLITKNAADVEATRLLSNSLAPRYTYSLTCTSKMLSLKLGQQVNIKNTRYGLSSGKTGQVISLSPNWSKGTIDIEVLV